MPLPSLFFIGKNGTPIEIVTGLTKTVDELHSKINKVLSITKPTSSVSPSTASANLIASMVDFINQLFSDGIEIDFINKLFMLMAIVSR